MPTLVALAVLLFASTVRTDAGLVEIASAHDVKETIARLEAALARANATVGAKIDQQAAAPKGGERGRRGGEEDGRRAPDVRRSRDRALTRARSGGRLSGPARRHGIPIANG